MDPRKCKKYHCPPQLYWYSPKRRVVWSVSGPVLLLGVLPILCVQSKSSPSTLVNPHKSAVSKVQSSGPESSVRMEYKLIDSVQYYREGYALTLPKGPWNLTFSVKKPGNLSLLLMLLLFLIIRCNPRVHRLRAVGSLQFFVRARHSNNICVFYSQKA